LIGRILSHQTALGQNSSAAGIATSSPAAAPPMPKPKPLRRPFAFPHQPPGRATRHRLHAGRTKTVIIGIGGGLVAIVCNRQLARREIERLARFKSSSAERFNDPATRAKYEWWMRYMFIGAGVFFIIVGVQTLLRN